MYCKSCGSDVGDSRFCPNCGTSVGPQKELYKGSLRSNDGEEWKYESSDFICTEGNPKGSSFKWEGSSFISTKNVGPKGLWNGKSVSWRFQNQNEDFYVFSWDDSKKSWKCEVGLKRTIPNLRISYVHWKVNGSCLELEEGSDFKEGTSVKWEVFGDIPVTHPLVAMIAMFTRSQKLLDENIERSKRVYKRCGKLILSSAGPTLLCKNCANVANDRCIVCDGDCSSIKFPGKICKTCGPRKNFCIKCSDPLFGSKKEGFLCNSCGIGKTSDNCAKMLLHPFKIIIKNPQNIVLYSHSNKSYFNFP